MTPRRPNDSIQPENRRIPPIRSCRACHAMHGLHDSGPLLVPSIDHQSRGSGRSWRQTDPHPAVILARHCRVGTRGHQAAAGARMGAIRHPALKVRRRSLTLRGTRRTSTLSRAHGIPECCHVPRESTLPDMGRASPFPATSGQSASAKSSTSSAMPTAGRGSSRTTSIGIPDPPSMSSWTTTRTSTSALASR